MNHRPFTPISRNLRLAKLIVPPLLGFCLLSFVSAQDNSGTIRGQVSNQGTGTLLEGAKVTLEPANHVMLTERDGGYVFTPLAPGTYRLKVEFTGLEPGQAEVRLDAGQRVVRDIELSSEIYRLSNFTVVGEREGNAQAITLQRNAPNVKNVISADAFGNIADGNIGNFLQRLPGLSVKDDEGEIYRVMIRGIAPELNSVSIDGTRIANATNRGAATESMGRAIEIDKLPADFIERIEVTKAMTPDMDADSIGGSINLKTKSALDYKQRVISYLAGSSYNVRRQTFRPIGNIMYSDVLGADKKFGLLFTASYNRTHKPRDSAGLDHESTTDTTRPAYHWIRFVGEDQLQHERTGLGLTLDYKLSATSRLYFNAMYAKYTDHLERRRITLTVPVARIQPGWTNTVTETAVQPNVQFVRLSQSRDRRNDTFGYKLGGESRFLKGRLDYGASYSMSDGSDLRMRVDAPITGVGFRFDRSRSREFPAITQLGGPDINNVQNAAISRVDDTDQEARDRIWGGEANFLLRPGTVAPTAVKTGMRYRRQKRSVDESIERFGNFAGTGGIGRFLQTSYNYVPLDGRYTGWSFLDDDLVLAEARRSPQSFVRDALISTRDDLRNDAAAEESILAAYLMGNLSLGQLTILGGLRAEETRIKGTGSVQVITPEERARRAAFVGTVTPAETERRARAEFGNLRTASGEYRDLFPSLHFKFQLTPGLQARASYSTGIGRPAFSNIVPLTTVNTDAMILTTNNINLKPQYADNFDLFLEYYFEPAGVISIGGFMKEIRQFIYSDSGGRIVAGDRNGFDGQYEGYELRSNFNGGSARVRGWEAAYQQQFSHWPGFWRGFGAFANYTVTESKGNYGQPGQALTSAALEDFAPRSANAGVSYIARGWTVRVKVNHRKDTLTTYNADPSRRVYVRSCNPVDVNLRYDWSRRISIFADIINLFDVPTSDWYLFIPSRPYRSEHFTTAVKFGINGRY